MTDDRKKLLKSFKYVALGAIRRKFSYSQTVKDIYSARISEKTGPRGGKMYICDGEGCGDSASTSKMNVDHIEPVIPLDKSYDDLTLDEITERIVCEPENLQLLCKACHDKKTEIEKDIRKEHRKAKKGKLGLIV